MTQLSHSVPAIPHLTVPTLPIPTIFVKSKITECLFDDFDSLNALMTEEYQRYITHHKRAFYYVLLIG